jgi:HK97 family phage major capsid protein
MTDSTLQFLWKLLDKYGRPLINLETGRPFLYGKPVYIAPSMPSIGSKGNVVIFGDLSYFMVRCAVDQSYVQIFKEAPGLVENGEVGFRMFTRYDGKLLFSGLTSPPINYLQCHS